MLKWMRKKVAFPLRGLVKSSAYARTPGGATQSALNVLPFDQDEDRFRGGKRPGTSRVMADQVTGAADAVQRMKQITLATGTPAGTIADTDFTGSGWTGWTDPFPDPGSGPDGDGPGGGWLRPIPPGVADPAWPASDPTHDGVDAGVLSAPAGGITGNSIQLAYGNPSGGALPYTNTIYQQSGTAWESVDTITPGTPLVVTGLTPATEYTFFALTADDSSPIKRAYTSTLTETTADALVAGTLTATATGKNTISLDYATPTGGVQPYSSEAFQKDGDAWVSLGTITVADDLVASDLDAGTEYTFKVTTTDAGSPDPQTADSSEASDTTEADAATNVLTITGIDATAKTLDLLFENPDPEFVDAFSVSNTTVLVLQSSTDEDTWTTQGSALSISSPYKAVSATTDALTEDVTTFFRINLQNSLTTSLANSNTVSHKFASSPTEVFDYAVSGALEPISSCFSTSAYYVDDLQGSLSISESTTGADIHGNYLPFDITAGFTYGFGTGTCANKTPVSTSSHFNLSVFSVTSTGIAAALHAGDINVGNYSGTIPASGDFSVTLTPDPDNAFTGNLTVSMTKE